MDGAVAPFDRIVGLDQISVLQNIVRHQNTAGMHQPLDLRQKNGILSLGCIHKDKIIGTCQGRQNLLRIPLDQMDTLLFFARAKFARAIGIRGG